MNISKNELDINKSIDTENSLKLIEELKFNLNLNDDNLLNDIPGPITKRWDPLGAASDSSLLISELNDNYNCTDENLIKNLDSIVNDDKIIDKNRLKSLEDEQEILTQSLMALTSHFAQVQFRLRQIVESPLIERDKLLKSLEEFAFRGIPEIAEFENEQEINWKSLLESEGASSNTLLNSNFKDNSSDSIKNNIIETEQQRQFDIIHRLKRQLTDLEKFAYDSGAPVLPQSILLEKQKIIIDELKQKLNLNLCETDLPQLTTEDLKQEIDAALVEFTGPFKMKEQLVIQLKTQITDLERFIAYLQCSDDCIIPQTDEFKLKLLPNWLRNKVTNDKKTDAYNTYSAKKKAAAVSKSRTHSESTPTSDTKTKKFTKFSNEIDENFQQQNQENSTLNSSDTKSVPLSNTLNQNKTDVLNQKAHNLLDKASTLLQMVAVTQFGCATQNHFDKNTLKKTKWGNHWGDIRAQLELDIQEIIGLVRAIEQIIPKHNQLEQDATKTTNRLKNFNKKQNSTIPALNIELTTLIRKNFSCTLQKLIQHGLRMDLNTTTGNNLIVPFIGCFTSGNIINNNNNNNQNYLNNDNDDINKLNGREMHAWELILEYYHLKNGDDYNSTPARKLSQSFNLDIISGNSNQLSTKESLLSCIGNIIQMHHPYKRSYNSTFKAFICASLNANKLVQWLSLILHCNNLIDNHYESWSYIKRTGFNDALHSIDLLTKYNFELPIDLAVRQFENIKDVFM